MRRSSIGSAGAGPWLALSVAAAALILISFVLNLAVYGPGHDAVWYLAAGQRVNAGHQLYSLSPGDLPIPIDPLIFPSPFLYPPAFAIVWAPLAALPSLAGLWMWWVMVTAVMVLWAADQLCVGGRRAALLLGAVSFAIGQTLETGNVNGLLMVAFGLAWTWRDKPFASGVTIGTLAAWKVFPGLIVLWMLVTRRWRAAATSLGCAGAWTAGGVVLIGPSATWTYLTDVVPRTQAMGISLAALTDVPQLTYVALGVGIVALWSLRSRPSASYIVAVCTAVLAWPSLGIASLGMLAGLAPVLRPTDASLRPSSHASVP